MNAKKWRDVKEMRQRIERLLRERDSFCRAFERIGKLAPQGERTDVERMAAAVEARITAGEARNRWLEFALKTVAVEAGQNVSPHALLNEANFIALMLDLRALTTAAARDSQATRRLDRMIALLEQQGRKE